MINAMSVVITIGVNTEDHRIRKAVMAMIMTTCFVFKSLSITELIN